MTCSTTFPTRTYDDIAWAHAAGVTKGCNPPLNTNFCPDRPISRAETAAFVRRMATSGEVDAGTLDGASAGDLANPIAGVGIPLATGSAMAPSGSSEAILSAEYDPADGAWLFLDFGGVVLTGVDPNPDAIDPAVGIAWLQMNAPECGLFGVEPPDEAVVGTPVATTSFDGQPSALSRSAVVELTETATFTLCFMLVSPQDLLIAEAHLNGIQSSAGSSATVSPPTGTPMSPNRGLTGGG